MRHYLAEFSHMTWDAFSRRILEFQNLFYVFPQLLYSLLKIQIYDLLLKANAEEAEKLYYRNFGMLSHYSKFIQTHRHFFSLFRAEEDVTRQAINEEYANLKHEFFVEFENLISESLSYEPIYLFKSKKKINFKQTVLCLLSEFPVSPIERLIFEKIQEFTDSSYQLSIIGIFMGNLQRSNLFNILSCIKPDIELSSQVEEIISPLSQEVLYSNKAIENSINIENSLPLHELPQDFADPSAIPIINCDISMPFAKYDPCLNLNRLERPLAAPSEAKFKFDIPFLKFFKPKFMKRDNINKKIIRRFRRFVKFRIELEQGIQNYMLNIANDSDANIEYRFAFSNALPPFRIADQEFKSFNSKYLFWLFANSKLRSHFEAFAQEDAIKLSNELINYYNLEINESMICCKLIFYVENLSKFYSNSKEVQFEHKALTSMPSKQKMLSTDCTIDNQVI